VFKFLKAVTALVLVMSMGVGSAQSATTTALSTVNVRSGPGVNFALLGNLVGGQVVDVIRCQNNWCLIDSVGPDGWVSAEYLASVGDVSSLPPGIGPAGNRIITASSVSTAPDLAGTPYALVNVTNEVIAKLADVQQAERMPGLAASATSAPFQARMRAGDQVQLTIFEGADGGLFFPRGAGNTAANFVTFPTQSIDEKGILSVPFAGDIDASGMSVHDLESAIAKRLESRAIEPQVVVSTISQSANFVTILGSVQAPQRYTLTAFGDRVLDVIAAAGGLSVPDFESYVVLTRNGVEHRILFSDLVASPQENIHLQPGDVVYVGSQRRSFVALGAVNLTGQVDFTSEVVTLGEALARVGGLQGNTADPGQIFVIRQEKRTTVAGLVAELDTDLFPEDLESITVAYRVDFSSPTTFMLANHFELLNADVIYVGTSASAALN
jgi:polysaccharide export outer membrane protein